MRSLDCPLCGMQAGFFMEAHARHFYRCDSCDLIFLYPSERLNPQEELERYQLHQNNDQDSGYRAFLNQLAKPLIERLSAPKEGLDYGCGPGPTLSKMLEKKGFKMKVYDPYFFNDESVLHQTYDFITCTETAEHFFSPGKEFKKLDQLLKPGGWLGLLTQWVQPDRNFDQWHYPKDPTHVCFYSRETMRWIAGEYGWNLVVPAENVTLFYKLNV